MLRLDRDAAENHVRLEEQTALDRKCPAASQPTAGSGGCRSGSTTLTAVPGSSVSRRTYARIESSRPSLSGSSSTGISSSSSDPSLARRSEPPVDRRFRAGARTRRRDALPRPADRPAPALTSRSGTRPAGRRSDVTAGTSATTTPGSVKQPELEPELRSLGQRAINDRFVNCSGRTTVTTMSSRPCRRREISPSTASTASVPCGRTSSRGSPPV